MVLVDCGLMVPVAQKWCMDVGAECVVLVRQSTKRKHAGGCSKINRALLGMHDTSSFVPYACTPCGAVTTTVMSFCYVL